MNDIQYFGIIVFSELIIFGLVFGIVFGRTMLSTINSNHKVSLEWAADLKAFQLESLKLHIHNQKLLKLIERNTRELQIQNSRYWKEQKEKEVAESEDVFFIDLNAITADKYDVLGPEEVKKFFPGDHTHTNVEGAKVNAASVVQGIRNLGDRLPLISYLKNNESKIY